MKVGERLARVLLSHLGLKEEQLQEAFGGEDVGVGLGVFNSIRSTDFNPNQKNQNRIRTVLQKNPNGTYELTTSDFGYNPNRTEIRIRIQRYPKLVKYVNVFIYIKVIKIF